VNSLIYRSARHGFTPYDGPEAEAHTQSVKDKVHFR
jgi:hypothetical protein